MTEEIVPLLRPHWDLALAWQCWPAEYALASLLGERMEQVGPGRCQEARPEAQNLRAAVQPVAGRLAPSAS